MQRRTALVSLIVAFSIATHVTAGFAAQSYDEQTFNRDLRMVIERYGLQIVDEVPAGVRPLSVSSVRQLEHVIRSINADVLMRSTQVPTKRSADSVLLMSGGTILRVYHWSSSGFAPYRYNLSANVYISSYGSFSWIDRIGTVRFYLSGITLGVYLKDVWTDSEIDPHNGQCAWISGGGTVCWYVIIRDVLTYYQKPAAIYEYVNIAQ